jgi:hypothetical protein
VCVKTMMMCVMRLYAYETLYLRACVHACVSVRARDDDAHVYACDVALVVLSVSVAGLCWHLRLYIAVVCICTSQCLLGSILFPVVTRPLCQ